MGCIGEISCKNNSSKPTCRRMYSRAYPARRVAMTDMLLYGSSRFDQSVLCSCTAPVVASLSKFFGRIPSTLCHALGSVSVHLLKPDILATRNYHILMLCCMGEDSSDTVVAILQRAHNFSALSWYLCILFVAALLLRAGPILKELGALSELRTISLYTTSYR